MGQPKLRGGGREFWSRPFPALLFLVGALVVAFAALRASLRMHADRERLETGDAEWIWHTKDVRTPAWVRFYATREFHLNAVPPAAVAKVFGDRRHVLYINGFGLGGTEQKPGDPLWLHDLTPQLRRGENRIAVVLESNTGVGGLLFALDVAGLGRNVVVSDERWRVDLDDRALRAGGRRPAMSWGRPPMYPWGYPRLLRPDGRAAAVPASATRVSFRSSLPRS